MHIPQVEWLTPEEIAMYLDVSIGAVYGWLRSGDLDHIRAGKLFRVKPAALETFLRRQK